MKQLFILFISFFMLTSSASAVTISPGVVICFNNVTSTVSEDISIDSMVVDQNGVAVNVSNEWLYFIMLPTLLSSDDLTSDGNVTVDEIMLNQSNDTAVEVVDNLNVNQTNVTETVENVTEIVDISQTNVTESTVTENATIIVDESVVTENDTVDTVDLVNNTTVEVITETELTEELMNDTTSQVQINEDVNVSAVDNASTFETEQVNLTENTTIPKKIQEHKKDKNEGV